MDFDNNTVYVLDSYGLIFRCYFAFINKPLTNPQGQNISALFGFFRNLHYILQHYKPGCIIAAMDSKTKTFRHELFPEYKATRNKTPEDLHAQIPWICDILENLGIPVLQCDGYEADDIIATIAKKCENQGRTCRILSGDKDLMQLVNESTQILKPESGGIWKVTGTEGVEAEWGVKPAQLLDLLSLYGDTADNIPGVMGVGVKTAAKLLNDYKNLDGIYAHIDEIKGAMQKKLIDGKENAYFSQKLVKLCDTVPCHNIDTAMDTENFKLNYAASALLLQKYGALAVSKQYAALAVENGQKLETGGEILPLSPKSSATPAGFSATPSSGATDSTILPRNAPFESGEDEPVAEIKQNDTSAYRAITKISDLENYITEFLSQKTTETASLFAPALPIAYDSETDSLDTINAKILGFSLCWQKGQAVYVPLQQEVTDLFSATDYIEKQDALKQLSRLFSDERVTVIFHNAKFDLKVLESNGLNVLDLLEKQQALRAASEPAGRGGEQQSASQGEASPSYPFKDVRSRERLNRGETSPSSAYTDTMLLAWLQNPDRGGKSAYGLEYLSETKLGLKGIEFSEIVAKGQTFADVPLETAYKYAAEDADFTLQLWQKLTEKYAAKKDGAIENLYAMELQVLPVLAKMELTGIHLDSGNLNGYSKELTLGIEQAEKAIYAEVGHEFNIASPKQLQTVLFEERGLKAGKKTKTGYSTDTSVLEELAAVDSVPKMILEYREMAKLQSTYVDTLPQLTDSAGRIHTTFVQTGTATGRLSCRDPNLQNIPVRSDAGRKIRGAFTAPEGKVLISADYSQIELVVLAHLSGDVNMCKAFTSGTDVHKATASMIFGVTPENVTADMRRTAKTINFGVIYGMSAFSLAKDLGISRTQAQSFIDMYFATYSSVSNFMTNVISSAEQCGYVETLFGRRRYIMNINSRNKLEKSGAERMAKNTPIQGTAADIVKKAMLNVSAALKESGSPAKLLLQVHDELIFECPDNQKTIEETLNLIRDKMENAVKLSVPLKVSIEYGKNWGEFH